MTERANAVSVICQAAQRAAAHLLERAEVVELIVLAALAGEHVLLVGPAGTGKSTIAQRVAQAFGGRHFQYLFGRSSELVEIFGANSDAELTARPSNTLLTSEFGYLDELFAGSSPMLNRVLSALHEVERTLQVCVAACQRRPEDLTLLSVADRFLVNCHLAPVPDHHLERLLQQGRLLQGAVNGDPEALSSLQIVRQAACEVDLSEVQAALASAVRALRRVGVNLSDRRIVRAQGLIATVAALDGCACAGEQHLWPLLYVVPDAAEQAQARGALAHLLDCAVHPLQKRNSELAAFAPVSEVSRLLEQVKALDLSDASAVQSWLNQLARHFPDAHLPAELQPWRDLARAAQA